MTFGLYNTFDNPQGCHIIREALYFLKSTSNDFLLPMQKGPLLRATCRTGHPRHRCHLLAAHNRSELGKQVPRHQRLSRTPPHR